MQAMTLQRVSLRAALLGVLTLAPALAAHAAKPADKPQPSTATAKLVHAALQAELAGDATERAKLLSEARVQRPDDSPARWHSGEVLFDGAWRSIDDVAALVQHDVRRQEYKTLRAASGDAPADHVALAHWCAQRGLANQERFHWSSVLRQAPNKVEAQHALGLHEFEGGLFTRQNIDDIEASRKQAEQDLKRFRPIVLDIRRRAAARGSAARDAALEELRLISDPAAIPAIEEMLASGASYKRELRKLGRAGMEEFHHQLSLAATQALGHMPQHVATVELAKVAVLADWPDARILAAELLKPRPKTDYMPLFMAALQAPIESSVSVFAAPDGTIRLMQTYFQDGPDGDHSHTRFISYEVENALEQRALVDKQHIAAVASSNRARAAGRVETDQLSVQARNEAAQQLNQRIISTLRIATGEDFGDDPAAWWQAWFDQNELYYTEDEPVYDTYEYDDYSYSYPVRPTYIPQRVVKPRPRTTSCFAKGTPVWTDAGAVPIDQITAGDMVLSQDPLTGELAYRPVLATTLRPPTRTVNLSVGGETITATLGHRFWTNGQGWQMAKSLKPQAALHTVEGPATLAAIEGGESVEAYNLMVDDFHTYFVGQSRLLVHDNSCPRPTRAPIPGMTPPAK